MSTESADLDLIQYEFKTKQGNVKISFEDISTNPTFELRGPKELMSKVIAGIGEENETEAWVTEKHIKTEAQRMYVMLEIIKLTQGK